MFIRDTILSRLTRGCQTIHYPRQAPPPLPDRHGGALRLESSKCPNECSLCAQVCPSKAISQANGTAPVLDLGKCLFCAECVKACPSQAILRTGDYRMATRQRKDLLLSSPGKEELRLAASLEGKMLKMFGRSLKLRQVSAGGCGACEADINVLGTIGWDLSRFGIRYVASPRHADGLLVTGPVSKNMDLALKKTYAAVSEPKIVIAVGVCAISGGPFASHSQVNRGVDTVIPVDLYIPGCPPHPLTILDGFLRLLNRLEKQV